VLDALSYLHATGCPHRDVKPDNIIVFDAAYKLADLGIVKWSDFDPRFTTGGTLTRASMQLGSWFYMAPEQQQDPHDAVPASDVYALGISWIEMLTGQLPAPHAVGANQYPRPCEDAAVTDMIRRMVAYSPGQRPSLSEVKALAERLA
jgi:serine/threonine-protein kinase